MTHQSPLLAPAPRPTAAIAVLRCTDRFDMDPTPLARLFADMSQAEGEDIICRVLEDIASRLDRLHDLRFTGGAEAVPKQARRVAAVARQIGLTMVAMAAEHVACAAQMQNGIALGATMARLERSFDLAVSHVWDYQRFLTQ